MASYLSHLVQAASQSAFVQRIMESPFHPANVSGVLHILIGIPLLVAVGPLLLGTPKGKRLHVRLGHVYFVGMTVLIVTGVANTLYKHAFEHFVPVVVARNVCFNFLGYSFVYGGYRTLRLRQHGALRPFDTLVAVAALASALVLIGLAFAAPEYPDHLVRSYTPLHVFGQRLDVAMLVWGLVGLGFSVSDLRRSQADFRGRPALRHHARRLVLSYGFLWTIASIFILRLLPYSLRWTWGAWVGLLAGEILSARFSPRPADRGLREGVVVGIADRQPPPI